MVAQIWLHPERVELRVTKERLNEGPKLKWNKWEQLQQKYKKLEKKLQKTIKKKKKK